VCSLLLESQLDVTMIEHYASDQTVKLVAAHRLHLVGSDGIFGAKPHPRLYGAAARFLGRFVLREQLVSVEEAVARLSARAADRLGLSDRGRIRRGQRADLVLRHPDGVVGVWVAGRPVWREGRATGERPGGVVREPRR